jgi:hypothetical protein
MGAWGVGITQNDTVLDVSHTFVDQLRKTQSVAKAAAGVRKEFAHALVNEDEAVQVRLGLAMSQWQYGALPPALLKAIHGDLAAGRGIASYGALAAAREKAVRAFIAKLSIPNAKPRALPKPPKVPKRPRPTAPAAFAPGDCLALKFRGPLWRAALVLVSDIIPHGDGFNVVALLDWKGANPPQPRVFAATPGKTTPRLRGMGMFSGAYDGKAPATVVGNVSIDPAQFGIEKTPRFWTWRLVRGPEPIESACWDVLPELRFY